MPRANLGGIADGVGQDGHRLLGVGVFDQLAVLGQCLVHALHGVITKRPILIDAGAQARYLRAPLQFAGDASVLHVRNQQTG